VGPFVEQQVLELFNLIVKGLHGVEVAVDDVVDQTSRDLHRAGPCSTANR
jgi:hypothetical protein